MSLDVAGSGEQLVQRPRGARPGGGEGLGPAGGNGVGALSGVMGLWAVLLFRGC